MAHTRRGHCRRAEAARAEAVWAEAVWAQRRCGSHLAAAAKVDIDARVGEEEADAVGMPLVRRAHQRRLPLARVAALASGRRPPPGKRWPRSTRGSSIATAAHRRRARRESRPTDAPERYSPGASRRCRGRGSSSSRCPPRRGSCRRGSRPGTRRGSACLHWHRGTPSRCLRRTPNISPPPLNPLQQS